jgi:hypothetical protein
MDFVSTKNIILKKAYVDLIILKLISDFQEEMKINHNSENKFNKIGMIENNWIKELKNKYLYDKYLTEIKKVSIKNFNLSRVSKIYLDEIKKLEEKNELDIKSKEKIKIINKEINNRQIKYITDFEIVDIEAINLLKILYNDFSDYYCEGEYYFSNDCMYSNVIICFQDLDTNYYYQIGKIYQNNVFVSNYIVYFNKNIKSSFLLENYLSSKRKVQEFFDRIYYNACNNITIPYYFHKLNFNDDLDCLKNIFSLISQFEEESKKNIINEEKIYSYENCYLIDKNCLSEFKKIFQFNDNNINDKNIFVNDKQKYFNIFFNKKNMKIFLISKMN